MIDLTPYTDSNGDIDLKKELIQELAGIVTSGSNTNGSYVRFSDGTQICWGETTYTGPCSQQVGSQYRSNDSVTLPTSPVGFVGEVHRDFYIIPHSSGTDAVIFGIELQSQASRLDFFTPILHSNITVKIGFTYKGRWK